MKISQLGEFNFIKRFQPIFSDKLGVGVVGIGDDCSVVPFDKDLYQITTTDLLIEGVHFLKEKISPFDLGVKSINVSVSDIAAMGGTPESAFLSIAIPNNIEVSYLDEFYRGINHACKRYSISLLGGDTSHSLSDLMINILIQGKVEKKQVKLRSSASVGDIICLTGPLGDSKIGLEMILGKYSSHDQEYFLEKHNFPLAHLEEARFLSKYNDVHAMIDVSDGLSSDIHHICIQSKVKAILDSDLIPFSKEASKILEIMENKIEFILNSGEEYCLLLTLSKKMKKSIFKAYSEKFSKELYEIGEIVDGAGVFIKKGKNLKVLRPKGFDHFQGAAIEKI